MRIGSYWVGRSPTTKQHFLPDTIPPFVGASLVIFPGHLRIATAGTISFLPSPGTATVIQRRTCPLRLLNCPSAPMCELLLKIPQLRSQATLNPLLSWLGDTVRGSSLLAREACSRGGKKRKGTVRPNRWFDETGGDRNLKRAPGC